MTAKKSDMTLENNSLKQLTYEFQGQTITKNWVTENSFSLPKKVIVIDDSFSADRYTSLASQGTSFVWKGDYHNAKQLLQAVQRRIKKNAPVSQATDPQTMAKEFYRHRQHQAHKAQLLSRLLVCVEADLSIQLPRAPDLSQAISEATVLPPGDFLISLRELQGFVGAHEWRKKGVAIAALGGKKIHAYYGVFSPVRGEYLDLVASAPLPVPTKVAFDIGTGAGVISAVLAHRGVQKIIATDMDDRALQCASSNIKNLGFDKQVTIEKKNLFPEGKADLVVCNPPWLPAKPTSAIERAVYDEDSGMLKAFLNGVGNHLNDNGEAWLIISDLAEHLGLRGPNDLTSWNAQAKLEVIDCMKIQPRHSKANDEDDPLHSARAKEITMLWRLKKS
jgi:methylase of polypeptide subunit release factors